MALVPTEFHWETCEGVKCGVLPAAPPSEQPSQIRRIRTPKGLAGSNPARLDHSSQGARLAVSENLGEKKKKRETFHGHFTFCSVSLQEKAKESLMDKGFQDSENRGNLQLIEALDSCHSPLTSSPEAEWF